MRRDINFVIFFIGIILIYFWSEGVLWNKTFVFRDFSRYFYPYYIFTKESLDNLSFPLWSPYVYCGFPFFAALQPQILYPLSVIKYILPSPLGINLFIILHFILAAIFSYLLVKDLTGNNRIAGCVSGIVYIFGGYFLSNIDMFSSLCAATWMPIIFLLFKKLMDNFDKRYVIPVAAALLMQFLAGEPFVLYATTFILFLYCICKFMIIKKIRVFVYITFIYIIFFFISAFQSFPTIEYVLNSTRVDQTYKEGVFFSLHPAELLSFVIPAFKGIITDVIHAYFGQMWLKSLYFGILPFLMAIIAILFIREKIVYYFSFLLIVSLLLALGDNLFFYKYLYEYLPGFKLMRYPVKFMCVASFAISVLAGLGYNYLLKNITYKKLHYFFLVSTLSLGILSLLWSLAKEKILDFIIYKTSIWHPLGFYIEIAINTMIITSIVFIFYIIFSICSRVSSVNFFKILSSSMIILLIGDIFLFSRKLNPTVGGEFYLYQPKAVAFFKKDRQMYRIIRDINTMRYTEIVRIGKDELLEVVFYKTKHEFSLPAFIQETQRCLTPNFGLMHRIFHADGYESLKLRDYMRLYTRMLYSNIEDVHQMLNFLNVKYIITKFEVKDKPSWLALVFEDKTPKKFGHMVGISPDTIKIYKNTTYLDRVTLVPRYKIIKDEKKALDYLLSRKFNPKKEVVLNTHPKIKNMSKEFSGNYHCKILNYSLNRVEVEVISPQDCFLVLSDTYYPGWSAYIDNKSTIIYKANYAFRAIFLPKGKHIVKFIYSPLSFKLGSLISLFTIGLVIIYLKRLG